MAEINGPFSGEIERARADAKLIAAAPDMLAICQEILADLPDVPARREWPSPLEVKLRAVIAAATGEGQ